MNWFIMWVLTTFLLSMMVVAVADWGMRQHEDLAKQRKATKQWRDDSLYWKAQARLGMYAEPVTWPELFPVEGNNHVHPER